MRPDGHHFDLAQRTIITMAALSKDDMVKFLAGTLAFVEGKGAREALDMEARILTERANLTMSALASKELKNAATRMNEKVKALDV